jgi:hypothetical protein
MTFDFEIGLNEKHHVQLRYEAFSNSFSALVDGIERYSSQSLIAVGFTFTYEFQVGFQEVNRVMVMRTRKVFFPLFRKQEYIVYINGFQMHAFER